MLIVYFRRRYAESKSLVGCVRGCFDEKKATLLRSQRRQASEIKTSFSTCFSPALSRLFARFLCAHRYSSRKPPRSKVKRSAAMKEIAFPSAADLKNEELKSPVLFFLWQTTATLFFQRSFNSFFVVVTLLLYLACGFYI
jgi:hypothetical protein